VRHCASAVSSRGWHSRRWVSATASITARALAKRPTIILADEPTGNLDTRSGREVVALLHELAAGGATLMLITHDEEVAETFPRRIQMRDGELVGDERQ
jgi:putative ABC transport system ATP-binding protein